MAVNIAVSGDNLGAIVVGDHNTVVINQPAGAVVLPAQPVRTTRREGPANLGPRPFPDLVDRIEEEKTSRVALTGVPPASVDVSGPPGIGKTALLRHVCGDSTLQAAFPDGVIYLDAARQSASDILQQLFEAFFETDRPFKPDETQLRRFLARTSALVMLDGYSEPPGNFDRLLNLAATATFAVAGPQRVLLGEGCAVTLDGLRPADALALMSRELARPIDESEVMAARTICAALDGNPLNVILVAAHSRVYGVPLAQLAGEVRAADSPEEWLKALINSKLSERDRAALAAFAAVDCAPLDTSEVAAISGAPAAETLESLKDRRLIEYDGKRNRVRTGIVAAIAMSFLGMLPAEAAAQSFLHAAAQSPQSALVEHSDAIMGAIKHAALSGNHADVLALAHRAGDAVALSGRWDRWHEMLQQALDVARTAHDAAGEAWALHQIGSSALALGDFAAAQTALEAALHIRSGLGDPNALAATQHNLEVLGVHAAAHSESAQTASTATRWGMASKIAVGLVLAVVLTSVGAWVAAHPSVSAVVRNPTIRPGGTTKVCVTASHVSNLRMNGTPASRGCVTVHPTRSTTYRIEGTGPLGIPIAQSVRVEVSSAAPPPQRIPPPNPVQPNPPQPNQPQPNTPAQNANGPVHQGGLPPIPSTHTPIVVVNPNFPTHHPTVPSPSPTKTSSSTNPCDSNYVYINEGGHHTCGRPSAAPTYVPPNNVGSNNPCYSKTGEYPAFYNEGGHHNCGKPTAAPTFTPPSTVGTNTGCGSKNSYQPTVTISKPHCGTSVPGSTQTSKQGKTTGLIAVPPGYAAPTKSGTKTSNNGSTYNTYQHVPTNGTYQHVPATQIEKSFTSPSGYSRSSNPYSETGSPYSRFGYPNSKPGAPYSQAVPHATRHPSTPNPYPTKRPPASAGYPPA